MKLLDARRLTGPNHLAPTPLVIVELGFDDGDTEERATNTYAAELSRMRSALGFTDQVELVARAHRGGIVLGYAAPIDIMLPLADVSEWAGESASSIASGGEPYALEPKRAEFAELIEKARNPRLLALEETCIERDMPFLWDDERVSVGLGRKSLSFERDAIPDVADIPWEDVGKIRVALITGTNGKTTSSRLLAHIAKCAGIIVGSTSTDHVRVGDAILERGDWTGPSAARVVLRHKDVQMAVLETARGGILRRGLAVQTCDAALITNVTVDHVGGYGIDDLNAMTRVKGVVAEAVDPDGTVVLNAADPYLVDFADGVVAKVTFFANLDGPQGGDKRSKQAKRVIDNHLAVRGGAVIARSGEIVCIQAGTGAETVIANVADAPITFGGAAAYNIDNVLGAVAMAQAMWIDNAAIVRGLASFTMAENPGRGQLHEKNGVKVLLDFGHNTDGIRAVMALIAKLREEKGKLTIIAGSPGDRTNEDLGDMVKAIADARPDRVIVRELPKYLRGRALGEIPAIFERVLTTAGLASIELADSEVHALEVALAGASRGDFVALLVHIDQEEVNAYLKGV